MYLEKTSKAASEGKWCRTNQDILFQELKPADFYALLTFLDFKKNNLLY